LSYIGPGVKGVGVEKTHMKNIDHLYYGQRNIKAGDRGFDSSQSKGVSVKEKDEILNRLRAVGGDPKWDAHLTELCLYFPLDETGRWAFCIGKVMGDSGYKVIEYHCALLDDKQRETIKYNPFKIEDLFDPSSRNPELDQNQQPISLPEFGGLNALKSTEKKVLNLHKRIRKLKNDNPDEKPKDSLSRGVAAHVLAAAYRVMRPGSAEGNKQILFLMRSMGADIVRWLFYLLPAAYLKKFSFITFFGVENDATLYETKKRFYRFNILIRKDGDPTRDSALGNMISTCWEGNKRILVQQFESRENPLPEKVGPAWVNMMMDLLEFRCLFTDTTMPTNEQVKKLALMMELSENIAFLPADSANAQDKIELSGIYSICLQSPKFVEPTELLAGLQYYQKAHNNEPEALRKAYKWAINHVLARAWKLVDEKQYASLYGIIELFLANWRCLAFDRAAENLDETKQWMSPFLEDASHVFTNRSMFWILTLWEKAELIKEEFVKKAFCKTFKALSKEEQHLASLLQTALEPYYKALDKYNDALQKEDKTLAKMAKEAIQWSGMEKYGKRLFRFCNMAEKEGILTNTLKDGINEYFEMLRTFKNNIPEEEVRIQNINRKAFSAIDEKSPTAKILYVHMKQRQKHHFVNFVKFVEKMSRQYTIWKK
jgi:hypothetical protein